MNLIITETKCMTISFTKNFQHHITEIKKHKSSCIADIPGCDCFTIHKVDKIKFLEVYLDQCVHWNEHIDYMSSRLGKLACKFYQLRSKLNKTMFTVYEALVKSILRYCTIVWESIYKSSLSNLEMI